MASIALGWAQVQRYPVTPLWQRCLWKESQKVRQDLGTDSDDVI